MRQGLAALLVWLGGPAWAACGDALPATGRLVAEAIGWRNAQALVRGAGKA